MTGAEIKEAPYPDWVIEQCPWRDTDHLGERRQNYCAYCDGFEAGFEYAQRVTV